MSSETDNSPASKSPDAGSGLKLSDRSAKSPDSAGVAHELANLLDSGMRNVSLVLSQLRDAAEHHLEDELVLTDPVHRLESADLALKQMGQLLHRWMRVRGRGGDPYNQDQTLEQAVNQAVTLLGPGATEAGVTFQVQLSPQVSSLPAGALYPVIANALRNSLEAIAESPESQGTIHLLAAIEDDALELGVTDNGPGISRDICDTHGNIQVGLTTKAAGHGIGLMLCDQIIAGLSGQWRLLNVQPRGARFELRVPLRSLERT